MVRRVRERLPGLRFSVSVTTRPRRPSEREGVDYRFVSGPGFDELVAEDGLLEWAEVFGHRYGTPRRWVEERLTSGEDVVLEIDVRGAEQVRRAKPEAVLIFLDPPSLRELERRLRARGTEDETTLARRLEEAGWEREQREWFDHVVVNDDVEHASTQVAAIIEASRSLSEGSAHP